MKTVDKDIKPGIQYGHPMLLAPQPLKGTSQKMNQQRIMFVVSGLHSSVSKPTLRMFQMTFVRDPPDADDTAQVWFLLPSARAEITQS